MQSCRFTHPFPTKHFAFVIVLYVVRKTTIHNIDIMAAK